MVIRIVGRARSHHRVALHSSDTAAGSGDGVGWPISVDRGSPRVAGRRLALNLSLRFGAGLTLPSVYNSTYPAATPPYAVRIPEVTVAPTASGAPPPYFHRPHRSSLQGATPRDQQNGFECLPVTRAASRRNSQTCSASPRQRSI